MGRLNVNNMEKQQCKHEFKEVKYTIQEAIIKHWDYKDHLITTLTHEKVKLFCIHCGDVK